MSGPIDDGRNLRVVFTPFVFVSHMQPNGLLPADARAHACWYYCRLAITHWKTVDEGAEYEGERDHTEGLKNLVWSVATLYRIKDPDEFLRFMPICKAEAEAHQLQWDYRIEHPEVGTFIRVAN